MDKFIALKENLPVEADLPPGTIAFNRYKNVLPRPETRVVLPLLEEAEEDEIENSDFVNANWMRGWDGYTKKYIAAQAPKVETVDRFWRLVWHAKSVVIAMVTGVC